MREYKDKLKAIFKTYWPLAVSWLFMAVDTPAITAIVSRMNDPKNVLAAHGTTYPLILLIESPVLMLTSASLALCCDGKNYRRIRRMAILICLAVTALHALICVPPIFDLVFVKILNTPRELLAYCHEELLFVIPWSGLIGFRRFNQGILIRTGRSGKVTIGTILRMVTMLGSLFIFLALKDRCTGARAAGLSLSLCVALESIYNGIEGHKAAVRELSGLETDEPLITWNELSAFVYPLVLTSLMNNIWMSIGSAAVNRMIEPVISLAVWPVISSMLSLLKSWGNAINETTLAKLPEPGMRKPMERFTLYVTVFTLLVFLAFALPPVNDLWYLKVSSLRSDLAEVSKSAFPFVILVPVLCPVQQYYQAILISRKRTDAVFVSLLVYLAVVVAVFSVGLYTKRWMGIYVMVSGMSLATAGQVLFLRSRVRRTDP